MKLEILVPQYTETYDVIKPLLDSLEIQRGIDLKDIGVIMVNDGSDVIIDNIILDSYSYPIQYIKNEHLGVSATRNECLKHSTADYVMFCDADDCFYGVDSIYTIFECINNQNDRPDVINGTFLEELKIDNEVKYLLRNEDNIFVHGKIYRRSYLIDNEIRFNPNLTVHEDSYFTKLARVYSEKIVTIAKPIYVWCWRSDSVCRKDPLYILKTYGDLIDSSTALVEKLCELKKATEAITLTTATIYDAYFQFNKEEWNKPENSKYRLLAEKKIASYYSKFLPLHNLIDEEVKRGIIIGIRNRMYGEGLMMEMITFDDWIKHIEDLAHEEKLL